ncbi:MAG: DNA polymerase III [Candidatus Wildermuthbacteria bacterium RIFCSPHIGHO2_01_FULL_48_25]|uniref:DNA polymerase beta n=1 Tax=Candidatus Wildermuthbacteria bacterium RIFCSPLOWO2_01_FULL_48_16 TaxID=1802461 RepID=A0A1G2RJM7_9BACT|nr:MAG: DNA polymerase III [Candidatus Wildermuthbacteria bacterium RIFCSPHIGHO2_01_FULL_48_25]OHA68426.1 MAG: DNA polymerase III [Candidatus Wildermuthbacteria bacterium RIFCSPHIGHO2_02_FULL_49_12b]OHA73043.1 MAG: DNA polymerase III [Candidatus Wildermuthbacteria bacterium RIFCSPLOWO2_01_FULL_48_16]
MKNQEIAKILYNMATYLAMEDVPFKPQAYERAAMALESLGEDVEGLYKKEGMKGLEKIPGVGRGIAEKIEEYLKTDKVKEYEKMRKTMPVNMDELGLVEGIGPKMMRDLWKHLKVKDLKTLEAAAKVGKIQKLPHFGLKTEQNILNGIAFAKKSKGRWLLGTIYPYMEEIVALLKDSNLVKEAVAAGSIRRMKETIGDVDILVTTKKPKEIIEYFLSHMKYSKLWGKGPTKVSLRTLQGFDIDVRVLDEEVFGVGLQYFTGSKEHNVKLRTHAIQKGYKLSEYGLFKGKKRIACKTEEEVYKALGMPYIEPEMREDTGEIEAALRGKLPKVIGYDSLKGDLQVQTDWSDGNNSIEEMAKEAKAQGLEYIAITDHTRDLAMTGGSDEKKLLRQMAAIDKLNRKISGIKILKGAEVNIRRDGTLDIANEVLAKLDVVGVSVHTLFKMTQKDMTERIIRAIRNPHVDILFHPTGRLIHEREPYALDMDALIKEARKTGTVLEANASPRRLDLKDTDIKKAVQAGVKLSIDSDSHRKEHFRFLKFGIAQARRGWVEKNDVINALSFNRLLDILARKR